MHHAVAKENEAAQDPPQYCTSARSNYMEEFDNRILAANRIHGVQIYTIWVCLKMLCTPLYPMVLLIIIPTKWLFVWGYIPFSDILI